jgi:hypothetical protein
MLASFGLGAVVDAHEEGMNADACPDTRSIERVRLVERLDLLAGLRLEYEERADHSLSVVSKQAPGDDGRDRAGGQMGLVVLVVLQAQRSRAGLVQAVYDEDRQGRRFRPLLVHAH